MEKVYSHFNEARECMFNAEYEQALSHWQQAINWCDQNLEPFSIHYRMCNSHRVYCLYKSNKFQEAIDFSQPMIDYYVTNRLDFDTMVNKAFYVVEKSQAKLNQ